MLPYPRLITAPASARDAEALREVGRRAARDIGASPWGWCAEPLRREAWLWDGGVGAVMFVRDDPLGPWDVWAVWLAPELRRRGLLTAAWPPFEARYGPFRVRSPSDALAAFLRKRGWTEPGGVWWPGGPVWTPPD